MIDVALITKNEEAKILPTLESIIHEIPLNNLIIIDASNDRTPQLIENYLHDRNLLKHLKLTEEPGKGCGYARQLALDTIETPVFAFVDAGAILPHKWFHYLSPHLKNHDTAIAAGSTVFGLHCPPLRNHYEYQAIKGRFNPTLSNALLKTELINKVGGFNPEYTTGEDLDLSIRIKDAGMKWIIDPNTLTYQPRSLTEHIRQISKWSKGTAILKKNQNIGTWSIKHLLRSFKNAATDTRIHPTWLLLAPIMRLYWLNGFYKHTKEIRKK